MRAPTNPTPFQNMVLNVPEAYNIALLGGRGGGKTTCALLLVLRHCVQYGERARALIIRQSYKGLADVEDFLALMLAAAFPGGFSHNRAEHVFRLASGATIELGQIESARDYPKYQGRETTLLVVEEFTNFKTDRYVKLLKSNLRGPADMPLREVITGNPGGPLHTQISRRHVNGRMPWRPYEVDGEMWVTCPSVYTDNPHIDHARYARQITAAAGNDRILAEAWLSNRWDALRGAFFADVWGDHLILPSSDWRVPPGTLAQTGWYSFVALDWGWSAPSVALFVAQTHQPRLSGPNGRSYPRGSYIILDELATARPDDPNEGLQWPPSKLAEEVLARCERWGVRPHGVGDDARGIQNDTLLEQFRKFGLFLDKPVKDRVSGWVKLKQLMASARDKDGDRPGVFVSERCRYLLETMPTLPRDELRPEDVDTAAADHGADALRYAVVHEPRIARFGRVTGIL